MGRFVHEACAVDPQDGHRLHDRGQRPRRLLPLHPRPPRASSIAAASSRCSASTAARKYDTVTGQKVGKKLALRVGDDRRSRSRGRRAPRHPGLRPGSREGRRPVHGPRGRILGRGQRLVHRQRGRRHPSRSGLALHAGARTVKHGTLELVFESSNRDRCSTSRTRSCVSPRGGVLLCEDGDGEDLDGGTNNLRVLTPAGQDGDLPDQQHAAGPPSLGGREEGLASGAASGRAPASARTASGCSSTSRSPASPTRSPDPGRRVGCDRLRERVGAESAPVREDGRPLTEPRT